MEMSAFMTEHLKDHLKEQRDHDEQVRRGLEAKVEAQRVEMDKLREEAMQAKLEAAETKVREGAVETKRARRAEQLGALQHRLEVLHQAQLLKDEELYDVEDAIADSEAGADGDCVPTLVALSGKMSSDRAFARQLIRKKWL
jgi:predicted  nucleic acid-binding Zn-ribbon protein